MNWVFAYEYQITPWTGTVFVAFPERMANTSIRFDWWATKNTQERRKFYKDTGNNKISQKNTNLRCTKSNLVLIVLIPRSGGTVSLGISLAGISFYIWEGYILKSKRHRGLISYRGSKSNFWAEWGGGLKKASSRFNCCKQTEQLATLVTVWSDVTRPIPHKRKESPSVSQQYDFKLK